MYIFYILVIHLYIYYYWTFKLRAKLVLEPGSLVLTTIYVCMAVINMTCTIIIYTYSRSPQTLSTKIYLKNEMRNILVLYRITACTHIYIIHIWFTIILNYKYRLCTNIWYPRSDSILIPVETYFKLWSYYDKSTYFIRPEMRNQQ